MTHRFGKIFLIADKCAGQHEVQNLASTVCRISAQSNPTVEQVVKFRATTAFAIEHAASGQNPVAQLVPLDDVELTVRQGVANGRFTD